MKHFQTLSLLLIIAFSANSQVKWAEQGSSWYLKFIHIPCCINYSNYAVVGDTLVQGKVCSIIDQTWHCGSLEIITYEEDDVVYFFNHTLNEFVVWFDFTKMPGENWQIVACQEFEWYYDTLTVRVDSINSKFINGMSIPVQYVSYFDESGTMFDRDSIFKGIGSGHRVFPPGDSEFDGGPVKVCSYESPSLGLFVFDSLTCSFSPSHEIESIYKLELLPNPTHGTVTLHYDLPAQSSSAQVKISDFLGRRVKTFNLESGQGKILISDLPSGLHYISLLVGPKLVRTEKLVVGR